MELDPEFTFVPLEDNYFDSCDKKIRELLNKWGLKDNINVQRFSFDEHFQTYHKYHFAESFFRSENVIAGLKIKKGNKAHGVDVKQVFCTVTSMGFFDKLSDPSNNVVYTDRGNIRSKHDTVIDGFWVTDNLRSMLLDEECEEYNLYQSKEREEFIFRIFQMLVLGGELNQYEDELHPYLDVTKKMYKDLVRVKKQDGQLTISSMVLEVVAKNPDGSSFYPANSSNKQNVAFLCIDPESRVVTTFVHHFN